MPSIQQSTCPACGQTCRGARGLGAHRRWCPANRVATTPTCRDCGQPCTHVGGQCADCRQRDLRREAQNSYAAVQAQHRTPPPMGESRIVLALMKAETNPERHNQLWQLWMRLRAKEYGLLAR
jgi:hypothetical protein